MGMWDRAVGNVPIGTSAWEGQERASLGRPANDVNLSYYTWALWLLLIDCFYYNVPEKHMDLLRTHTKLTYNLTVASKTKPRLHIRNRSQSAHGKSSQAWKRSASSRLDQSRWLKARAMCVSKCVARSQAFGTSYFRKC